VASAGPIPGRVLVVDDEPRQREIIQLILEGDGFEVVEAGNSRQALLALRAQSFDLALTDLKMPDMNGIALLQEMVQAQPGLCVILMTAHGSIDSAVDAMRKGAFDYLTKPLEREVLLLVVKRAMERSLLVRENRLLHEQLHVRFRLDNMVGSHGSMQDVFRIVKKVAASNSTVLIYGESGTGKELVARALHQESERRDRPFYAVNVAAIPEGILENELFGHEKGAFTGADTRKIGIFEQASGSTLFLDEVGDLRKDLQVKLLRTLQEREIMRLGGNERIRVDVRILAATNQDLEEAVEEGRFREDLYYRLNVLPIRLPPLRERTTDVPLLVDHFLNKHAQGRKRTVSEAALKLLMAYDWPGNVRQLESVVERAILLSEGDVIGPEDIPSTAPGMGGSRIVNLPGIEFPDAGLDLDKLEAELIRKAIQKTDGNVSRAARLLGLSRRTLQYRLEKLGAAPERAGTAPKGAEPADLRTRETR
jgi:DNA-binding NtrC family response regulator